MKLLYLGCFVEPSQLNFIENVAHAEVTVSTTTFQRAFLSGFKDTNLKPDIINAPDIGSWPKRCKKMYFPGSRVTYHGMNCENVGFYNVTYLKQRFILGSLKRAIRRWLNKQEEKEVTIVVYSLIYSYLKAVIDIKKEFPNVKVCCIVLDLPEFFGDDNSWLYRLLGDATNKIYRIAQNIDSYVLLTEYMKDPLCVGMKPWMLMEGIYEPRKLSAVKKHPKTILYTGKLDARFGIRELVDNFSKLDGEGYSLWICGDGLDRVYVENKAKEDSRITFWGQVKQERAFEMQREASLLINPRKPEREYTKYSFPSKTMEYLASGTPTLMYKLPGMPNEYEPYVVLFNNSTDEEMLRVLEEWLNKSQKELDEFGAKARDFILKNKTSDKQVERFLRFICNTYGK